MPLTPVFLVVTHSPSMTYGQILSSHWIRVSARQEREYADTASLHRIARSRTNYGHE